MIVYCSNCNKELKRKPSQVKKIKNHFCNKECHAEWQSKNIRGEKHFSYSRISCICNNCGNEMELQKYRYEKYLNGETKNIFCSKKCQGEWQSKNNIGENHHNYNSVHKKCEYCGKDYIVPLHRKDISKYCSSECSHLSQIDKIKTNCSNCGKHIEIVPSKLGEHNFCCNKCVGEWNGEQRSQKKEKICVICGKLYEVRPALFDKSVTCSIECQNQWQQKIYSKQPEVIEFRRKIAVKNIKNQKYKDTKPEIMTREYLDKNNINYIPQHPMYNMFVVDFYLPDYNIVIEVLGDYWHGNPKKYHGKYSKKQLKVKRKDINKFITLIDKGHVVIGIWEFDIYQNIDNTLLELNKYINKSA